MGLGVGFDVTEEEAVDAAGDRRGAELQALSGSEVRRSDSAEQQRTDRCAIGDDVRF